MSGGESRTTAKPLIGKDVFLAVVPGALDADGTRVHTWLKELELATEIGPRWLPAAVSDDLRPRWTNVGLSSRCVDAFERCTDGRLRGVELKVSGNDGVCGLTLGEERLLRMGGPSAFAT